MNEEEINTRFETVEKRLDQLEKNTKKVAKEDSPIIEDIFEVNGEKVIVTKFSGENNETKTQNIVLLSLLGYKTKLELERVLTGNLRENVALNAIPLENFATYLNKLIPRYILRIGKPKSNKCEYKLTTFGEASTKNILKELNKNEDN